MYPSNRNRKSTGDSKLFSKRLELNAFDARGVIYLAAGVLFAVAAQLVLKLGLMSAGSCVDQLMIPCVGRKIVTGPIMLGISLHVIDTIFWIFAVSRLDLSFAYPASSLQYILIFAASWYVLGEHISSLRMVGLMVICTGIIVMFLDGRKI